MQDEIVPARTLPEHLLARSRVLPNREAVIPRLPRRISFCEVGVALGDFSLRVLEGAEISRFIALDLFTLHQYPEMWGGRIGAELNGRSHAAYFRDRFAREIEAGRMDMLEGNSTDMLETLPDASVDVFYIDAHHSYDAVRAELAVVHRKIAPGGWIWLNDYIMHDYMTDTQYGVVQATNQFMIEQNWEMLYFCLQAGMFCDVVLRQYVD
jgi:hypothetical protein